MIHCQNAGQKSGRYVSFLARMRTSVSQGHYSGIAVGIGITAYPPHRTGRAQLRHPAPTLGVDGIALSVRASTRRSCFPGSVSGTCRAGSRFPRPRPFAPPAPRRLAPARSSVSTLLWAGLTSPGRASSATAQEPSRCGPLVRPLAANPKTSRFPIEVRAYMLGSPTARDRRGTRADAPRRIAFRSLNGVGIPIDPFAAQYPACTFPCQRFTPSLAARRA
jgi:hypothetical protein